MVGNISAQPGLRHRFKSPMGRLYRIHELFKGKTLVALVGFDG